MKSEFFHILFRPLSEEIKFETEEENEKFISETNKKDIKIKMEIPTAPEEDLIDDIEFDIQTKTEDSDKENYEKIKDHNNQVITDWHKRCSIAGLLPKEFELITEKDSIKKEKTLDVETFKNDKEIKREIKK